MTDELCCPITDHLHLQYLHCQDLNLPKSKILVNNLYCYVNTYTNSTLIIKSEAPNAPHSDTNTQAEKYYDISNKFDSVFLLNILRYFLYSTTENK